MVMSFTLQSFSRPTSSNLISRISTGSDGEEIASGGQYSALSSDNRYVAFTSGQGQNQVLLKDLQTGFIRSVAINAAGAEADQPVIAFQFTADNRFLVLTSEATNLVSNDTNGQTDVFLKDIVTGSLTRISTAADGSQIAEGIEPNVTLAPILSADGRFLVFTSDATNLIGVGADTNGSKDVFVKDLQTGAIRRVSTNSAGGQANWSSDNATISADGRYVAFESTATDLVAGGTDGSRYLFLKDLQTGATTRIDVRLDESDSNNATRARFSDNGRYIVFESNAKNLVSGDNNGIKDIFRKDLQTGQIVRVSTKANGDEVHGNSSLATVSPDGRYVTFASDAPDLVAGDTTGRQDLFRKDLVTGEVIRLSVTAQGAEAVGGASVLGQFSADGRYIAFISLATNLVSGDGNGVPDVFLLDTALLPHRQAVLEGRYVEGKLQVGSASKVTIAWGDGAMDVLTPAGGTASFSHAYASAGTKNAVVTLNEGAQSWVRSYTVNLATGQMSAAGAADTLAGGAAADILVGDAFANIVQGKAGKDRLSGDAGNDTLWGGAGNDILTGGLGKDTFVFDLKPHKSSNLDKIADFNVQDDTIWLENKVFKVGKGSITKPGKLSKAAFFKGAAAHDANDRIIYDSKKGVLYYDADGNGAGVAVKIATLSKNLKITAADFFVI